MVGRGADASKPPAVIFRATSPKRKISTVVTADELARFHPIYVAALKAGMSGLKKKVNKKKRSSAK